MCNASDNPAPAGVPPNLKTTAELESLALELVSACKGAVSAADGGSYNSLLTSAARAAAKGRLLTQKLGTFGSICAGEWNSRQRKAAVELRV